jgi:hypothetical protein
VVEVVDVWVDDADRSFDVGRRCPPTRARTGRGIPVFGAGLNSEGGDSCQRGVHFGGFGCLARASMESADHGMYVPGPPRGTVEVLGLLGR